MSHLVSSLFLMPSKLDHLCVYVFWYLILLPSLAAMSIHSTRPALVFGGMRQQLMHAVALHLLVATRGRPIMGWVPSARAHTVLSAASGPSPWTIL